MQTIQESEMESILVYVFECHTPKISERLRCKPEPYLEKKEVRPLLDEKGVTAQEIGEY